MVDQASEHKVLYKIGIWIAEAAEKECYSSGEIFIKAKEDERFSVPKFLGEASIPDSENLIRLIDTVSHEMVKALELKREDGRVYLVSLGENKKGLHFRLLPRYRDAQGILDELDSEIKDTNDGLALMARWRKQYMLKERCTNKKPFADLCKKHEDAIAKIREALHNRAMTEQDFE